MSSTVCFLNNLRFETTLLVAGSGSVGSGLELVPTVAPFVSTGVSSIDLDLSRSRGVEADADRPLERLVGVFG
eukprot:2479809-Amphidinium_carterae.1